VAGNSQQILQSSDIIAYIAAYSAANAMPADSAWGTAPGGTYRDVGYTDGGLGFNIAADLRGRAGRPEHRRGRRDRDRAATST
jgi:hypothetical protein